MFYTKHRILHDTFIELISIKSRVQVLIKYSQVKSYFSCVHESKYMKSKLKVHNSYFKNSHLFNSKIVLNNIQRPPSHTHLQKNTHMFYSIKSVSRIIVEMILVHSVETLSSDAHVWSEVNFCFVFG